MSTPTLISPAELTGEYVLDEAHSRIGFIARHAMVTRVRGQFNRYEGSAHLDFENPENTRAEISIEVESIDTRNEQRDAHLRTNDFFDAPTHPRIEFRSSGARKLDEDNFVLLGDLTIKGVTKPVEIEFEHTGVARDPYGHLRAGFEGKTVINRTDFGVTFNAALETGGVLVSEKITLEFEISAIKGS